MVGEIKALLCSQLSRDFQRLAGPIHISLPALEARDEPILVVWCTGSKKGERKAWVFAGRQRKLGVLLLSFRGKHMHGVLFA